MTNILAALLVLAQASSASIPAVVVSAADIQTTLIDAMASGVTDHPIRTIDAGPGGVRCRRYHPQRSH